jgi:hypothetical protein
MLLLRLRIIRLASEVLLLSNATIGLLLPPVLLLVCGEPPRKLISGLSSCSLGKVICLLFVEILLAVS